MPLPSIALDTCLRYKTGTKTLHLSLALAPITWITASPSILRSDQHITHIQEEYIPLTQSHVV
ncbi:hypothetical protein HBI40_046940 [Parastagonospora nodorum]|nr:hypothetical protein HBI76_098630 [Parastagonospora nodorum]KAH5972747.1 hypothetical protein HBI85_051020 [Parastagonospora nodorum]KAH6229550.1 hypothetical protein HBI53_037120 [Parastagonospora nodorum]KAH6298437.1 hypothetical protein HBI40_046940 [Parastagonospora nodorum]KAH6423204.1 hypothetical protein HBI08_073150 [Parastagonospora nodorum]